MSSIFQEAQKRFPDERLTGPVAIPVFEGDPQPTVTQADPVSQDPSGNVVIADPYQDPDDNSQNENFPLRLPDFSINAVNLPPGDPVEDGNLPRFIAAQPETQFAAMQLGLAKDRGLLQWSQMLAGLDVGRDTFDTLKPVDLEQYEIELGEVAKRIPWRAGITRSEVEYIKKDSRIQAWTSALIEEQGTLSSLAAGLGGFLIEGIMHPATPLAVGVGVGAVALAPWLGAGALAVGIIGGAADAAVSLLAEGAIAMNRQEPLDTLDTVLIGGLSLTLGGWAASSTRKTAISNELRQELIDGVQAARDRLQSEIGSEVDEAVSTLKAFAFELGLDISDEEIKLLPAAIEAAITKRGGKLKDTDFRDISDIDPTKNPDLKTFKNTEDVLKNLQKVVKKKPLSKIRFGGETIKLEIDDILSQAMYKIGTAPDGEADEIIGAVVDGLLRSGLITRDMGNLEDLVLQASKQYASEVFDSATNVLGRRVLGSTVKFQVTERGISKINRILDDVEARYKHTDEVDTAGSSNYNELVQKLEMGSVSGSSAEQQQFIESIDDLASNVFSRLDEETKTAAKQQVEKAKQAFAKFKEQAEVCFG